MNVVPPASTRSPMLVDAGKACAAFHDAKGRGVKARRVHVDGIWSFRAANQKDVSTMKKPIQGEATLGLGQ